MLPAKLLAALATAFTVKSNRPSGPGATPSATSATVDITTTGSTTYAQTITATATAAKVGVCIAAAGSADTTGAVQATSITVSQPGPNGCTAIGRRFGAGPTGTGNGG